VAAHEDLGIILVKSTLIISNSGHVLDDNSVVGVLALLVEDRVSLNHVIDDIGLGDLLRAELLLRAQVLAIVVTKVVVAGNRGQLDTSVDQKVHEGRLHLGLARLEVVATNESIIPLDKINSTGDEGVLGRAIDERSTLEDRGNSEDGGGGNLLVALLDRLEKVLSSVVNAVDQGSETVDFHGLPDILADLINMSHAGLGSGKDVVGTVLLVGSNEIGVVDAGQGNHLGHLLADEGLEGRLEDLGAVHGSSEVQAADVPTANDQVIGVDHGKDLVEGNVNVHMGLGISAQLDS
jgi:hypothetical protein